MRFLAVGIAAALTVALGGTAGATRAVTPVDGTYRGAHLLQLTGSLEAGFTIKAAESWMVFGCEVKAGTELQRYKPLGGGKFAVTWITVYATTTQGQEGVTCEYIWDGGPSTVTVAGGGKKPISLSGCSGACVGLGTTFTKVASTPAKDTSPPQILARTKGMQTTSPKESTKGKLTYPGSTDTLRFEVKDDSGRATVHLAVYEGGTDVGIGGAKPFAATGKTQSWTLAFPAKLVGPLYFCVWAEDAAGNRSAKAPYSSCQWISLVAPIAKVSNGCGGGIATWVVKFQNYFGNEHTYFDSGTGFHYPVNFKAACDLHDAGYGGHTVKDTLRGGIFRDYRNWTRAQVDGQFGADLRKICHMKIPARAEGALESCTEGAAYYALGVHHLIGAETLYGFVRNYGDNFFDFDLTKPGLQTPAEKKTARTSFDF